MSGDAPPGPAPPMTALAKLEAHQAKVDAGLLAIAAVFATIAAKHLKGTKWQSVYELPWFNKLWPEDCYSEQTALKIQSGIRWSRGYHSGVRKLKPTPEEVEERWLRFAEEASRLTGGSERSHASLSSALIVMRDRDDEDKMQQRLVASGKVVAVDHLAALEDKRAEEAAEFKAQLERQQLDTAQFHQRLLDSQNLIIDKQVALESTSENLSRKIEHLSAKKASSRKFRGNQVDSDEDDEAPHSPPSWRTSRADPPSPSPTPSSSRHRRTAPALEPDLQHEADPEASASSSRSHRSYRHQVPDDTPSTSTRPSSSSRRRHAHLEPSSAAPHSTHRALTRRRSPVPNASGSSTAEHGDDDVQIEFSPATVAHKGDYLKVGAAKPDDAADEADAEGGELQRAPPSRKRISREATVRSSRSSRRIAAAVVDEKDKGQELELDEPENALDVRHSRNGSPSRTSQVHVAPMTSIRRFVPTRSIVQDAAERGDPATPSASAAREAPARGALKRRTVQAPTVEHGGPVRSGIEGASRSHRREAGARAFDKEVASQRGVPEEAPELERLRAKLAAVGHGRDDGEESPGHAASSGFNSPASRSPSPPASPNVTPRSKARRRRRMSMYGEADFNALVGAPGTVARAQA